MVVLEGIYVGQEKPTFHKLPPPADNEGKGLVRTLSIRILRWLTRHGHFEASGEASTDLFCEQEPVLATCMAASIQYWIGLGPRAGQKRLGVWEQWRSVFMKKRK